MTGLDEFQRHIEAIYLRRDSARGLAPTFMWFVEEVGELSRALARQDDPAALRGEVADVLAWLSTLASMKGIRLEEAAGKYARGCPRCQGIPCRCP
ncbi:MAG: nucleotide pyrophosphohydrolase [Planctomycetes bacterium]|nr:nucleotide pyrophosphohydrolase [Planctomycetota bacterium]